MDADSAFASDPSEPLAPWTREEEPSESLAGARCERFELSSRGDRVAGRLLLPARTKQRPPLVLLACGTPGSVDPEPVQAARAWMGLGAAVACIDLPLHGARASAKLGERALRGLARPTAPAPSVDGRLWELLVRQAVVDLRRTLDFLGAHAAIDAARSLCAGSGVGAVAGAIFCAVDPRPAAAALAFCAGGMGPAAVDPVRWIGRVAPRPVLLVHARSDPRVEPESMTRLDAAAGEPKQIVWLEGEHDLPARALDAMTRFLGRHL
jgi:predicted esterase